MLFRGFFRGMISDGPIKHGVSSCNASNPNDFFLGGTLILERDHFVL